MSTADKGSLKPMVSAKGISSQDNGAQELRGSYTERPFLDHVGKNNSVEVPPLMGSSMVSTGGGVKVGGGSGGGDKLGAATHRTS